ncbi:uncharacterized protein V6R79_005428 [Siganus canaliculatus]
MGIRVVSQGPGKYVMACGHRYQQWSPSPSAYIPHLVTGQCYLLGDDLEAGTDERTWRRVVCDAEHLSKPKNQDWFAYCQQGHGASFAKDNNSLLFGAPGAYQWKGTVRMEPLDNLGISSEEPRETGNIGYFNSKLIPLQRTSYLGFSIDSGLALMRKGELTIVSGAPRGGYSGQVAFLTADPRAQRNLSVDLVISGPGLASSFGYDVAVVDINNDGWEDLAVGAPQFFVKEGAVGGAVYIYINKNGRNWDTVVPTQLVGKKDSMFGLAVENMGDVNRDGYGDIAVGAPYEGSGRVYLYYGSADGIHKKEAQVLSPRSKAVTLFGYSLSGNLDVDNNQYPDLAVGSLSDTVFVFRAKPVVSVSASLKVTPNEVDITKMQCNTKTCYFAVQACFTFTAQLSSFNPTLKINYTFEADAEKRNARLSPRVDFQDAAEGRLRLPGQKREICADTKLRLLHGIKDKLRSIPVSVAVSLMKSDDPSVATPVLNLYQQKKTVSEITFVNKGCGRDNICQSNLELHYKFCSKKTQNNQEVCNSLSGEDGVGVIKPSEEKIALEITATNRGGDDAHQSRLVISLPETLRYDSASWSADSQPPCQPNDKGSVVDCDLGNPLQRDAEITFYVILSTSGISLSTKNVNITMQLKTTSVQTIPPVEARAKVLFDMELQVFGLAKPSQVTLGKSLIGESAVKSVDDIGTPVQYEFRIINLGRPLKSFANASLIINWPKENSAGKWFLYLTQTSSKGVQPVPCSPASEVDPLKEIQGLRSPRKRRQAEFEAISTDPFSFLTTTRKYKTLTCSDELKCVLIRCPLQGLDSNALIVLHSRLWNSTFTEDYSSLNYLDIVVNASLSLTDSPDNIGLKPENPGTMVKLTVFFERETEYLVKVAWWIILLTVIALLLLLAVFCFLVWKRGWCRCTPLSKKHKPEDPKKRPVYL